MIRSTLTERWQTTIPAEVRSALRLKPRQGLLYELQGESVVVKPESESLMDLAGYFAPNQVRDGASPSIGDLRNTAHTFVAAKFLAS